MPLQKGRTNNTAGRIKGSKNKAPFTVKQKIDQMLTMSIDEVTEEFGLLKGEKKIKYFIELAKIVIPRPRDPEEQEDVNRRHSELMDRLFPKEKE